MVNSFYSTDSLSHDQPLKSKIQRGGESKDRSVLCISELAWELCISKPTAYQLARSENFPSFSIGRRLLVSREGLNAWIAERAGITQQGNLNAKERKL